MLSGPKLSNKGHCAEPKPNRSRSSASGCCCPRQPKYAGLSLTDDAKRQRREKLRRKVGLARGEEQTETAEYSKARREQYANRNEDEENMSFSQRMALASQREGLGGVCTEEAGRQDQWGERGAASGKGGVAC